jgi:hypothetical protein
MSSSVSQLLNGILDLATGNRLSSVEVEREPLRNERGEHVADRVTILATVEILPTNRNLEP